MSIEAVKIFLTAALSIVVSGIWLRHWQYREEFLERRLDDLINEIERAADFACEYWQCTVPTPLRLGSLRSVKAAYYHPKEGDVTEASIDDRVADLMARQLRIGALRSQVTDFFSSSASMELLLRETEFSRAMTGGEFGSRSRTYDPNRLREIRITAANYLNELRRARRVRLDTNVLRRVWRGS